MWRKKMVVFKIQTLIIHHTHTCNFKWPSILANIDYDMNDKYIYRSVYYWLHR